MFEDFHLLRPLWLLGIPSVFWLSYIINQKYWSSGNWEQAVEPHLLSFLVINPAAQKRKMMPWFIGFMGLLIFSALAGPVWKKLPQPLLQKSFARVIVLDLSYSMLATDLKPSRIERARFKLRDFFSQIEEGETALIAYAGEAFVISPLTHDPETVAALLPGLHPNIMPVPGSRPDLGVELASELLSRNQITNGHIILVTDGIENVETNAIQQARSSHRLSVLGVGTEAGSPIPFSKGGFLKDANGAIVVPKLNIIDLNQLAQQNEGHFSVLKNGGDDIEIIFAAETLESDFVEDQQKRTSDQWNEEGVWLLLILLPFAAYLFRKGLFFGLGWLLLLGHLLNPQMVVAFEWNDLWKRSDQQGSEWFQQGNHQKAEQTFSDPEWKGASAYRSGNYEKAIEHYSSKNKQASYNLANALARSGKLEEALQVYDKVLEKNPENEDAQFNRDLVEKLLKQNQDPQNQDPQNQDQQNQDQKENGEDSEASKAEQKENEENQDQSDEEQSQMSEPKELSPEEQAEAQALQQWLRKIPDDPGRLLRNKMIREYQRRGKPEIENKQYW